MSGFDHCFAEILRYQRLHDVRVDLPGKTVAHDAGRYFAFAEAGHARPLAVLLQQRCLLLADDVGWNLDADFAAASFIHAVRALGWLGGFDRVGCGLSRLGLGLRGFGGLLFEVQCASLPLPGWRIVSFWGKHSKRSV